MAHSAFGPYRMWHTIKKASTSVLSTLHLMSSRTSENQHTGIHWANRYFLFFRPLNVRSLYSRKSCTSSI
ncbi:hypothetical protein CEXT_735321 [Caerostris extrusa]|uniref:Uncharacterized protein n=1 Tax=Caerostris extrusa TaxID=172846 RepID=A0AAV4YA38_CAEEX|nr:hypothetical protein CEXT_735321 [Caerostris extrusa]